MKWILLMSLIGSHHQVLFAQATSIPEDYVWENRIILLFAAQANDPLLKQQDAEFQSDAEGIKARDLLVFQILSDQVDGPEVSKDAESAQKLRDQYHIEKGKFCVILIGKDGSEKLRKETPAELNELYALIDAMPMRRREMRDNSKN